MLALKAFVHESVEDLNDTKLRALAETLRIDVRGCEDRRDLERVVTGLLCLDQDTSLGVFVSWLRTSDASGALAPKRPFHNTFVPKVPASASSPSRASPSTASTSSAASDGAHHVPEHHLSDVIRGHLTELERLERDFKTAERVVHGGAPSFDKLKTFLVALTLLRNKEEATRRYLVQQNALLVAQHAEMRAEALHTRAQLDFFVDGFANLRQRHDALLETSTHMHAESEAVQDVMLAIAAHESHFAAVMAHTLNDQRLQNAALQQRVDAANATIAALEATQAELQATIRALKHARGDAQKDAHCYKRQLRGCKRKLTALEREGGANSGVFRHQASAMRQAFASLLGYLRDTVLRDTKTPKQTLSRETLHILRQALNSDYSYIDTSEEPTAPAPHMITKRVEAQRDLDDAMRGVLLLGGAAGENHACASLLSTTLWYASIDVTTSLLGFQTVERESQQQQQQCETETAAHAMSSTSDSDSSTTALERPLTIAAYSTQLKQLVVETIERGDARGFVLFNYEFTSLDVNQLLALGLPVDSVLELQLPGAVEAAAVRVLPPQLVQPAATTISSSTAPVHPQQSKASTRTQDGTNNTPATTTTSSSPSKSNSSSSSNSVARVPSANGKKQPTAVASKAPVKPTQVSPTRSATPKVLESSRRSDVAPTSATGKRPIATPSTPSSSQQQADVLSSSSSTAASSDKSTQPAPLNRAADRSKRFPGMAHLFVRVAPATCREERMAHILAALAVQRAKRVVPRVQWDDATQRTNELIAMFAEDLHMMLVVERERRKPTKPSGDSFGVSTTTSGTRTVAAASPSRANAKPTAGNSSRTASPTRAAAPPATPLARSSTKSPAKPTATTPATATSTATARGSGAAAVSTNRRATSMATPSSPPRTDAADAADHTPTNTDKKRASVATASTTSEKPHKQQ